MIICRYRRKDMMKLKEWVKVVLMILLIIVMILIIKDIFTKKVIVVTEGKNYTCYGSILQVCSGEDYDAE